MEEERKRRPRGLWYALGLLGVDMGVSFKTPRVDCLLRDLDDACPVHLAFETSWPR